MRPGVPGRGASGNHAGSTLKSRVYIVADLMPKAPPSSTLSDAPASYEAALQELEQLVSQLESGDLPLAQLLGGYQRGAALLKYCRDQLDAVEAQVKVLDEGVLKNWAPQ